MTLLTKRMVEKPWGKDVLRAPFVAPEGKRIGEVWFEPPPEMPSILVKYIFTSEKLSVQVHPNDEQAAAFGETDGGKEECWLVIDAEPGAVIGVGFKQPVDAEAMRQAALDGSIEGRMEWFPVSAGDFFYIPAGTVHAIGAGVSLIEIQQNSDVTYRMFDYGRARVLHLDRGIAVAKGKKYDCELHKNIPAQGNLSLVAGPFFFADRVVGEPESAVLSAYNQPTLVLPLTGKVVLGDVEVLAGECAYTDCIGNVDFQTSQICLVISNSKSLIGKA